MNKDKTLTGDTLYYVKDGESTGYGNVVYVDKKSKDSLTCNYLRYNEKPVMAFATRNPVAIRLFAERYPLGSFYSMRINTFHINTVRYTEVHAYLRLSAIAWICRPFAVPGFSILGSCITMYKGSLSSGKPSVAGREDSRSS